MASPAALPRIDINDSFGACLIAVVVAAALWGISVVQMWYYFSRYPKDMWYIKLLVIATFVFDTTHQILITHTVYWYVVTNYANPAQLAIMIWSILVEVFFNGLIGLLVQGFLTYRVYRLSHKNWLITGFLGSLVLGLFGVTMTYPIMALQLVTFADLHQIKHVSMSINAMGAVVDVLIATSLCALLQRSRTGFKKSDSMISKLMLFTVNTGLLTSIFAVLSLATFIAFPNTLIYVTFFFCLGRLYSNSLLTSLNCRNAIRAPGDEPESLSVSLVPVTPKGTSAFHTSNNISIKIDTTKEFTSDKKQAAATHYPSGQYTPNHKDYNGSQDFSTYDTAV